MRMKWKHIQNFLTRILKKIRPRVYLVGVADCEGNCVYSVHITKSGAKEAWNEYRHSLLEHAHHMNKWAIGQAEKWLNEHPDADKESIKYYKKVVKHGDEMYLDIIKNLHCRTPEKIDNFPHETPYINKMYLVF